MSDELTPLQKINLVHARRGDALVRGDTYEPSRATNPDDDDDIEREFRPLDRPNVIEVEGSSRQTAREFLGTIPPPMRADSVSFNDGSCSYMGHFVILNPSELAQVADIAARAIARSLKAQITAIKGEAQRMKPARKRKVEVV